MSVVSSLSGPRGFMVQLLVVFVIVFVIALLASLWDGSSSSSLPAPGVPGAVYSGQAVIEHDPVAQQAVRLLRTALQKVRGSPYEQDRTAAVHLVQWTDWRSEDLEDVLLTTRTLQLLHQSAGAADLTSGSGVIMHHTGTHSTSSSTNSSIGIVDTSVTSPIRSQHLVVNGLLAIINQQRSGIIGAAR